MKKKILFIGLSCCFIFAAGVCYSCAYKNQNTSAVFVSSSQEKAAAKDEEKVAETQKTGDINAVNMVSKELQKDTQEASGNTSAIIYVHICGAVEKPGVYETGSNARLIDLIELAGGLTKQADGDYINQAQPVADGQRIYIPTKEEVSKLSASDYFSGDAVSAEASDGKEALVNINTATLEELMELPGIGQSKANSIVEYRKSNGKFKTIEDIMNISGIKEGLYNQISSFITV